MISAYAPLSYVVIGFATIAAGVMLNLAYSLFLLWRSRRRFSR